MILSLLFMTMSSLQINRMFTLQDVKHLVRARIDIRKKRIEYGDFPKFDLVLVPSKIPKDVILCLESDRMHIFLHDWERIRSCVWDGNVTFDDKKEIVCNMMQWLNKTTYRFDHLLYDIEDGIVFSEVVDELNEIAEFDPFDF